MRTFAAEADRLSEVRAFVRDEAAGTGLSDSAVEDVVLAVSEACANAIVHSGGSRVQVRSRSRGGCIEIEVSDDGRFRRRVRMPELEGGGGHGISLMLSLMDEVAIREGTRARPGTVVRLAKCR